MYLFRFAVIFFFFQFIRYYSVDKYQVILLVLTLHIETKSKKQKPKLQWKKRSFDDKNIFVLFQLTIAIKNCFSDDRNFLYNKSFY